MARRTRGTTPHINACTLAWPDHVKVFDQLGNQIGPTIEVPDHNGQWDHDRALDAPTGRRS